MAAEILEAARTFGFAVAFVPVARPVGKGGPGHHRPGHASSSGRTLMSAADPYGRTIRQAAHDAVRTLLTAPPDSPEGSAALREVTAWLARARPAAILELAEELAVDLAEALDAIAARSSSATW